MGRLEGKVAAITGAGGGIGRAHALRFAAEGARVVVNDLGGARDGTGTGASMAEQVADEVRAAGGEAVASFDDVSERAGAQRVVDLAVEHYGRLDIMLSNAGILRDKTLLKMTDAMWDAVIAVHLRGTFLCAQTALAHMRERGDGGRIITTSSVSGLLGNFGQANYAAAKAGIYGFTRTAAMEAARYGVTVNALAPVALTRMTEDLPMMTDLPDAERLLAPEHVAAAALFLASDEAAHVSGEVLGVEGPRVFVYRMVKTDPVTPTGDGWTVEELAARWHEVSGAEAVPRN